MSFDLKLIVIVNLFLNIKNCLDYDKISETYGINVILVSDSTSILKIFGRISSVNLSFLLRQQIEFSHARRYLGRRK